MFQISRFVEQTQLRGDRLHKYDDNSSPTPEKRVVTLINQRVLIFVCMLQIPASSKSQNY